MHHRVLLFHFINPLFAINPTDEVHKKEKVKFYNIHYTSK